MNEIDRKALRDNHKKLVDGLDLTPDVYSHLYKSEVLTEDMIESIKGCKSRKESVQKLLMLLTRRGPEAFNEFVYAFQDQSKWLADDLRRSQQFHKNTEPERLSSKKTVDIFVHEQFGNSKRISETDKRKIRDFLYNLVKNKNIENNASDSSKIFLQVYSMLDDSDSESEEFDDVDGHAEVTIDMIERKVKDMNKKVDMLQNEINNCYTVLGVEKTEQPLHEVLNTILNDNKLVRLRKQLKACQKERDELMQKIEFDLQHRNEILKQLDELQKERYEMQIKILKDKCDRLQQYCLKHSEEQQTPLASECRFLPITASSPEPSRNKDKCNRQQQYRLHSQGQQTPTASERRVLPISASCPEPSRSNSGVGLPKGFKETNRKTVHLPQIIPPNRSRMERPNAENQHRPETLIHHEFPRTKPSYPENLNPWR